MDETTMTDQPEAVETESVDTEEVEVNRIDNMSDEEFDAEFEGTETDTVDDLENETADNEPKDLDVIYKENLGTDAKLDNPLVIKVDGTVYELDSLDEIRNLVERGTAVTSKFQKLSEDRKALEEQLAELGQTPRVAEDNTSVDDVEAVANNILASSYAETFTADMQGLDDQTKQTLAGNAQMLEGLSIDYQNGIGEKIMKQVPKLMRVNGLSFEEAYYTAGKSYQNTTQKQTQDKPKVEMLKAQPKKNSEVSSNELGRKAIDDMSDTEFDAYFATH